MNTKHTNSVETLRQEFTKWLTAETTFATGVPDDRSIADWWLEKISSLQATQSQQVEEAQAEYKQFVLNVLDGVDIADGQCNTKAIRFALQSRTIHSELDQPINSIIKE